MLTPLVIRLSFPPLQFIGIPFERLFVRLGFVTRGTYGECTGAYAERGERWYTTDGEHADGRELTSIDCDQCTSTFLKVLEPKRSRFESLKYRDTRRVQPQPSSTSLCFSTVLHDASQTSTIRTSAQCPAPLTLAPPARSLARVLTSRSFLVATAKTHFLPVSVTNANSCPFPSASSSHSTSFFPSSPPLPVVTDSAVLPGVGVVSLSLCCCCC